MLRLKNKLLTLSVKETLRHAALNVIPRSTYTLTGVVSLLLGCRGLLAGLAAGLPAGRLAGDRLLGEVVGDAAKHVKINTTFEIATILICISFL